MSAVVIPVILCGGSGSRLWPISREQNPKPFMTLPDGNSLIQKTFLKTQSILNNPEIITVINEKLLIKTMSAFDKVNKAKQAVSYILEPVGRNTTAAIASSALFAKKKFGEDAVLLILSADHHIEHEKLFIKAIKLALNLAKQGRLVTFGISPEKPETGYGYIKFDGNNVEHFIEKPSYNEALEYIKSGKYLWNSGIFCFSCKTILKEMELLCPEILAIAKCCIDKSHLRIVDNTTQVYLDKIIFSQIQNISIDYSVMEKSHRLSVIPCNIGWRDIGSWSAFSKYFSSDNNGNVIDSQAKIFARNTNDCYIKSSKRIVSTIGIKNLIIVDTDDALLIAHKDSDQDVKSIYNELKSLDCNEYKVHRTTTHSWGTYAILAHENLFKIIQIVINPNHKLELPSCRDITYWIVIKGVAKVVYGKKKTFLSQNQTISLVATEKYRIENTKISDLVMIGTQCAIA